MIEVFYTFKESDKKTFSLVAAEKFFCISSKKVDILYDKNGKPFAENICLSITNTKGFLAVAFCPFSIGIDAENTEFISEEKLNALKKLNIEGKTKQETTFLWCEKEASFKVEGKGNLLSFLRKDSSQKYYLKRFNLKDVCFATACVNDEEVAFYEM